MIQSDNRFESQLTFNIKNKKERKKRFSNEKRF